MSLTCIDFLSDSAFSPMFKSCCDMLRGFQINKGSFTRLVTSSLNVFFNPTNRRIHADVIVYIFAHLHMALHTEGNMLDKN